MIRELRYDRYSFIINGRREFIRSGAMHYFRLPSQATWWDRLSKLKAAGYNAVDLYFNWGFHSDAPGQYDFTGIRDVRRLLEMARELGLWVIARPGPYINAEVNGGGFPMWLIAQKDIPLRNRRDGAFVWSDAYMAYVREWWSQVLPIVNDFDHILMLQIENEYSTLEMEPDYMRALYQLARELGVTVPLSHNDLFIAGLYEDVVDLYAFDNYSVTQFESDWRKMAGIFSVLDHIENNLRPFCQDRPLIAAELQAGWFGTWQGQSYNLITSSLGREHINISTKTVLSQGLTAFNHYKAVGGTNWDNLGSSETYTSYDFGAPISEVGLNTVRLFEAKALNYFLASFDMTQTDRVEDWAALPLFFKNPEPILSVRKQAASPGYWIFLRNLESTPVQTDVELSLDADTRQTFSIKMPPQAMWILPYQIPLANGFSLELSNAEPLAFDVDGASQRLAFVVRGEVQVCLRVPAGQAVSLDADRSIDAEAVTLRTGADWVLVTAPALAPHQWISACVCVGDQILTILLLGQTAADRFWMLPDHDWLMGPQALLPDGQMALAQDVDQVLRMDRQGMVRARALPAAPAYPELPELTRWTSYPVGGELTDRERYRPIAESGIDLDANGQFFGCGWYRLALDADKVKAIELDAIHLWAVFCNGRLLRHGYHLPPVHGELDRNRVRVDLPEECFCADQNDVVIFVDSLGHPKGFHDDQQDPQGLRGLWILPDGEQAEAVMGSPWQARLSFCPGSPDRRAADVEQGHFWRLETTFTLPAALADWEAPLGVLITARDTLACERFNLYLNDALVGRYWQSCAAQETFYLPAGLLNPRGENRLTLLAVEFDLLVDEERARNLSESVSLVAYDMLYKAPLSEAG